MSKIISLVLILTGLISIAAGAFYWEQEKEILESSSLIITEPLTTPEPSPSIAASPTPQPSPFKNVYPTRAPKPVKIVIPKIGVNAPVVEVGIKLVHTERGLVAQWETADYAAGHHSTSANPGENGNIVISGHNNIKGKVFQRLWELRPGDRVLLFNAEGEGFIYEVKKVLIVREKGASEEQRRANARYIGPTPDETLTLITCWPPHGNSHRVIVIAKPVGVPLYREQVK